MKSRRRLRRTRHRIAQQSRVYDLTTAIIPLNAKIFVDEIDDPAGDRANVIRSTRDDPLSALRAQKVIDEVQFLAGQMWQWAYTRSEICGVKGIDLTKERVDGGRLSDPLQRNRRAVALLKAAQTALGTDGHILVTDIIGKGMTLAKAADARGYFTKDGRGYIGRRFRECLDCLAVVFGCATSTSTLPICKRSDLTRQQ